MSWLPLFHHPNSVQALVVGASSAALYKARWLQQGGANVTVVSLDLTEAQQAELDALGILWHQAEPTPAHCQGKNLLVVASEDAAWNQAFATQCQANPMPMFVWQHPELSTVSFPAIIDRDPVVVAISASGQTPMLSRYLRTRLEGLIPMGFGHLAELIQSFEHRVRAWLPDTAVRRRWWQQIYTSAIGERAIRGDLAAAKAALDEQLAQGEHQVQQWGEVALVGAGPGDPELLTFKALRLLQQADVVLYDRLVSAEILKLARRDAELIFVGKQRSHHAVPQAEINTLLVRYAQSGRQVCRLKGGDPFVFGRGGEELAELATAGVSFQVVPGITAASGCAAYAGIPLTHRDYAQSVRFVTGHLKNQTHQLNWSDLVSADQTLVFYMGLNAIPTIVRQLVQFGAPLDRPAALIEQGTTPQQRVVVATLETLQAQAEQAHIKAPTLIIIGDVVKLHAHLHWFQNTPAPAEQVAAPPVSFEYPE